MPTGYTAAIKDGITFEAYALSCARAFGALVMMRDEPSDAPIPEKFEPTNWHTDAIEKAKARRVELSDMTPDDADAAAQDAFEAARESYKKSLQEAADLKEKYEAMLEKVRAWSPPTEDHKGLHQFMATQIIDSIEFDCVTSYLTPPKRLTWIEWISSEFVKVEKDIEYHTKANAEEVARVASRNRWISALRKSLEKTND